jgi:hypothetical protein
MHIESIFLINFAGWAIAAPAQSVVLEKRQAIDVNGCWSRESSRSEGQYNTPDARSIM